MWGCREGKWLCQRAAAREGEGDVCVKEAPVAAAALTGPVEGGSEFLSWWTDLRGPSVCRLECVGLVKAGLHCDCGGDVPRGGFFFCVEEILTVFF